MQAFTAASASRIPAVLAMRGVAGMPRGLEQGEHAARRSFARGEELFAEGDACTFFYKIVSGTVRTGKLLVDGRRQIDAFHLAGDVFGLESGGQHRFTAEAVDDVVVVAYRRSRFVSLVHDDPAFGDQLMSSMLTSLDRAHDHMVLLGRKTALEKLASFLLDMARRSCGTDKVVLPMQRTDIADHLGLTIETVSRTLSQMVRKGLIRLGETGRTIVLVNHAGLQLLDT
jgi:CRP/FNR family transcriptional regulator, nitrogen fixation regulation protein